MSDEMQREIYKKLVLIEELLEKIEENTRPVVSIPTVWTWPPDNSSDSNSYNPDVKITWQVGDICTDEAPKVVELCRGNTGCNCSVCNPRHNRGCVLCGCQNIAIFTEDGNWWCNPCYRSKHDSEGNRRV